MVTARVWMSVAAAASLSAGIARAAYPYNGTSPIPSDPAVMALARKAVGQACRFETDKVGPQVAGFSNLANVGQAMTAAGFVFVRGRGPQRVAFMASEADDRCRILDVQPPPPAAKGEHYLQCRVDDPNPNAATPLAEGLGLVQRGKRAAFLEADFKRRALIARAADDKRLRCSEFESGD